MDTLTTTQKVPVIDQDGNPLGVGGAYSLVSSDPAVASVGDIGSFRLGVFGVAPGSFTVTATRSSDGKTATLDGTVGDSPAFSITWGTPEPK